MTVKDVPLVIRGPVSDLADLLHIARVEGRKILKLDKVRIKPIVYQYGNDYLVLVEPDGCSKALAVEGKKKEM